MSGREGDWVVLGIYVYIYGDLCEVFESGEFGEDCFFAELVEFYLEAWVGGGACYVFDSSFAELGVEDAVTDSVFARWAWGIW